MGAFDWTSQSLDWLKSRWHEDWSDFGKTFTQSWSSVPNAIAGMGVALSAMAPQKLQGIAPSLLGISTGAHDDHASFWGSARMLADSTIGLGSGLLGGTVGTIFQLPILHEAGWLLDKAYRYGVARPIATQFTFASNAERDAYAQGNMSIGNEFNQLLSWNNLRRAWNDSANITPGQAIVFNTRMVWGVPFEGEKSLTEWAKTHDPGTEQGQATFNSADSEGLLKYSSGSLDFGLNFFVDPGHGVSKLYKLGKAGLVDKVATAKYINAGKVHAELQLPFFAKLKAAALKAPSQEEFGLLTMAKNPHRNLLQSLLWHAAKRDDDIFNATYLTARAGDPAAFNHLLTRAPDIASAFENEFAHTTAADWDFQRGALSAPAGADALRKSKVEAFTDAMWGREGAWGKASMLGVGQARPKVSALAKVRAGVHTSLLATSPTIVGDLVKRPLVNLMPSQGWSAMIPSADNTAFSLRQFKANIERSNARGNSVLSNEEINRYAGWFGSATSPVTRSLISERVENLIIQRALKPYGLKKEDVGPILQEVNKWRQGSRRIINNETYYLSNEAAKNADRAAGEGRVADASDNYKIADEAEQARKDGQYSDAYAAYPDVDGHLNFVNVDGVNIHEPVMSSQFGPYIQMMDYRALHSALKWWNIAHPKPKFLPDPTDASKMVAQPLSGWRLGLAQAAKAKGFYDAAIGKLDAVSTLWKSSALFRPAQMPRNLGDEVLRTLIEFGKLPLMMMAGQGVVNSFRNFGKRSGLVYEQAREGWTAARGKGETVAHTEGDVDEHVPGNEDPTTGFMTPTAAYAWGAMSLEDYADHMMDLMGIRPGLGPKFGTARHGAPAPFTFGSSAGSAPTGPKRPSERPGMADEGYMNIHVGAPFFLESLVAKKYLRGELSYDEFKNNLGYIALSSMRPLRYMDQRWGMELVKDVINKHFDRRNMPGYEDNSYMGGTVVVDPFTGLQTPEGMHDLPNNWDISDAAVINTRNVAGNLGSRAGTIKSIASLKEIHLDLKKFVRDNADNLLRPGTQLAMRIRPDGNIMVGFAKAKQALIDTGATLKVGAKTRFKNFRFEGIRDSSHTGFQVDPRGGPGGPAPLKFEGWAEGAQGQATQRIASSYDNPSVSWMSLAQDVDMEQRLQLDAEQSPAIKPGHKDYATNWERVVNAQIASDPVMQRFLSRKADGTYRNVDDVVAEVWSSKWGHKWMNAMSFRKVGIFDQISQLQQIVNTYLPHPNREDVDASQAIALRKAALEQRATYNGVTLKDGGFIPGMNQIVPRETQPEVHGASVAYVAGNHRVNTVFKNTIRTIQKYLSDLPVDKIARFPFMSLAYKKHATELTKIAGQYFKDHDAIPEAVVNTIKNMAREKAYHDMRYSLYDTAQRNDFAYATRFLMPFSSAMMDSYIKYGRKIRENPMLLVQGAYYWDTFEREEMVQDENGNVAKYGPGGTLSWYSVDPDTGVKTLVPPEKVGKYKYVQFQLPTILAKVLGRKYYGVDAKPVLAVNKENLNVFLNMPSAGPLVAFPANEFALHHPEFADNSIIKKFVLPYGPSADRAKVALPSTVRSAWDAFVADDTTTPSGQAAAVMQAELIAYGLGTRNTPPTFEEARSKAASLRFLRFMTVFGAPAAVQLKSPYQPYIDSYRQLVEKDPATAGSEFMRLHGDEFYAVQLSVTRNNTGLTATLQSGKAYEKYKDLITRFPEFGGLIVGSEGAGEFSKAVYEQQKDTPLEDGSGRTLRQMIPLKDSVTELDTKVKWQKYSQLMDLITSALTDRGLKSVRSKGAEDLLAARDNFVLANKFWNDPVSGDKALSPWYADYQTSDRSAMESRIAALRVIAADDKLQKRDDIQGLARYLAQRDKMQAVLKQWSVKSLDSPSAAGFRNAWDEIVHNMVESNPAFGSLWNRWLSNDNTLDLVMEAGTSSADQPLPGQTFPPSVQYHDLALSGR